MRPQPWSPKPISTLWLDYATGEGVNDAGQRVKARPATVARSPTSPTN